MTQSEPRWLDETEMRAWNGFLVTASLIARVVDAQLSEAGGVSRVQYEILTRIHASPGRQHRMTELAESMVFSRSGMTYQVAQLEKAGLLRRETDPEDERGVLAILTDEGQQVLEAAAPGHLATVRQGFLDILSPEQISQLADIMDITSAHLRATVPVTPPRRSASTS
jgi:DNA-binding MarR family transcriptional regulator